MNSLPCQNDFLTHRVDTAHNLYIENKEAFIFYHLWMNFYKITMKLKIQM